MKRIYLIFWILFYSVLNGQSVTQSSSDIYNDLLQFQDNITVMYLAAHPDDENTKVISWLTHDQHVNAVYLSLTRGDGGQNLIGTEKGNLLGLLRTQELLEARKVDKGRQWFTRAIDFGFSKTATETLQLWDKDKVLSDVVWAIRTHKPAIIITRFDPNSNGKTHGHHTASALLALEAYDLASDPSAYPEQLKFVEPWQVKRVFFNTNWWFYGSKEKFETADKSDMISVDVGTYYPLLGISNNEISALSRSKHACQGFGMALERGSQIEWFQLLKGDMPKSNNMLDGINTFNNNKFKKVLNEIIQKYNFQQPSASLEELVHLYKIGQSEEVLNDQLNKVKELIRKTAGLYLEWTTKEAFATDGQKLKTRLEVTNRSPYILHWKVGRDEVSALKPNEQFEDEIVYTIRKDKYNTPYWLIDPHNDYTYTVMDQQLIGKPENTYQIDKNVSVQIFDTWFEFELPLTQKIVDPTLGEIYEPFYTVPAFVINFKQDNFIFNNRPKLLTLEVQSFVNNSEVTVTLIANDGWQVSEAQTIQTSYTGEKQEFNFTITPTKLAEEGDLYAQVDYNGKVYNQSLDIVNYPHIQKQINLKPAVVSLKNLNMNVPKVRIGYIYGSGDEIPSALQEVGLNVRELDLKDWNKDELKMFDVIILGIRAFNTQKELSHIQKDLWEFVENGGLVINQYNTNRSLITEKIAPIPLTLGRDRISEENAELKMLVPNHPIFNTPNKISSKDFDGWVQERGLYFASEWDDSFTPLLEGHDTDESPKQGILLVANYGKGHYIYTGLSFFRELPAGVPGAYRLFMNMLALDEK